MMAGFYFYFIQNARLVRGRFPRADITCTRNLRAGSPAFASHLWGVRLVDYSWSWPVLVSIWVNGQADGRGARGFEILAPSLEAVAQSRTLVREQTCGGWGGRRLDVCGRRY
jgi:hypothetical protein